MWQGVPKHNDDDDISDFLLKLAVGVTSPLWVPAAAVAGAFSKKSETKNAEQRKLEKQWEKEEREYKREQRREEIRAAQEYKRVERLYSTNYVRAILHLVEISEIDSKIHEKQKIFFDALESSFLQFSNDLCAYHIEAPLEFPTGEFKLVRKHVILNSKLPDQYDVLDTPYSGQPLNSVLYDRYGKQMRKIPIEIRQLALKIFNKKWKESGKETLFTPRQLSVMKCQFEHPQIKNSEIGEMLNIETVSVKDVNKEIKRKALDYFPKNPDFTIPKGNNKYVHTNVFAPFWWRQGFCFELPPEAEKEKPQI